MLSKVLSNVCIASVTLSITDSKNKNITNDAKDEDIIL